MSAADLNDAERFFYDHAGYCYNPSTETAEQGRVRCARSLAAAEAEGKRRGWRVVMDNDPLPIEPDDVETIEHVEAGDWLNLVVYLIDDDGQELGSLHGVTVAGIDDPYVRVVGAELADEARAELWTYGRNYSNTRGA